jgi:hypothetical protein
MGDDYSWLRHVCNGVLLSHDPEKTCVAVIGGKSVYLDDAGHPMDKPYLVLGGFIASESKWNEFAPAWEQTLKSRQIEGPFHATDFFSQHKNDRKLKHITADLIQTIATYAEWAFSIALDLDVYRRINRQRRLEELAGSPLALVSRTLRRNIEYYLELRRDRSPILYFIESGTFQYGDMAEIWTHIDKKEPPIPVPKSHPAAQAADLYAYSVYQSAPFEKGRPG